MTGPARGRQIVLCGLGGQGILYLTRVLAEAAVARGEEVLVAETHGMAQRGGAVEAHLRFGGYLSPLVRPGRVDLALVLDASREEAARNYLREGAPCLVNAEGGGPERVDATGIARRLDAPRSTNLVLLGFAAARIPDLLPPREVLLETIERLSPEAVRAANRAAFEAGAAAAPDGSPPGGPQGA